MVGGAIPQYRRIAASILESIKSGELASDSQLPSETELAKQFNVNRLTLRRAISELQRLGVVEIQRGKGTYVTSPPDLVEVVMSVGARSQRGDCLRESLAVNDAHTREEFLSLTPEHSPPPECEVLGSPSLIRIDTAMYRNDELWIINSYYLDEEYRGLPEVIGDYGYIIRALRRHYNIKLEYSWRAFSAEAASFEDAELFRVSTGTPLLVRDGITNIAGGKPLLYVRRRLLGDRAKFVLTYRDEDGE